MAKWKRQGPILGLIIVCLTAAVYAMATPTQAVRQSLPDVVPDLATVSRVEVAENGNVVLAGQLGPEAADGDEVQREAALTATAGDAAGEAEVEIEAADRTKQELEVEVERLTARTTYQVLVDGHVAGTITTDARGRGSLELTRGAVQE